MDTTHEADVYDYSTETLALESEPADPRAVTRGRCHGPLGCGR